jgi:hypothetical protein
MQYIPYPQKLLLCTLLCFSLVHCSDSSRPEYTKTEYIQVLDETPQHIQAVENLNIFSGDSETIYSIELIPVQSFGKTGEPYLTKILECVVDDKNRIIIYDSRPYSSGSYPFLYRVYAYNADGTYHTQIGGPGRGPGEYGMVFGVQAEAGKVFVLDYTSQRLNVYNTNDYSFERSTLIEQWAIRDQEVVEGLKFGGIETRNDGNHIVIFYKRDSDTGRLINTYLLMDTSGNALNFKPLVFPSTLNIQEKTIPPTPSVPAPFMGKTITALSSEDWLYSAWTQDFLIRKYDENGVYKSAIYYPVKGSPFDLSDYTEKARYNQQDVISALDQIDEELPESNPVIADLVVDDENRIWVAVPTGAKEDNYEWWILKESGELLAKLLHPSDEPIYEIKNGYLYSKKTNEEAGTEYSVKYRIELTEK